MSAAADETKGQVFTDAEQLYAGLAELRAYKGFSLEWHARLVQF
jgi:hypothetical protein